MKKEKCLVTNIQRFSIHDGPGIRTTIFFKGCTLKCPWCSNPENISSAKEYYIISDEGHGVYGTWMDLDEIYSEIIKDKEYYLLDGGITYSGGEPLLQMIKLEPLLKRLKKEKIHQCVETALFVSSPLVNIACSYIDKFYVDIKILEPKVCNDILGGNIEQYKKNVKILLENNCNVTFRLPLIVPYTFNERNITQIANFLSCIPNSEIEIIKGHNLAEKKYSSLGKKMFMVPEVSESDLRNVHSIFVNAGIQSKIYKI